MIKNTVRAVACLLILSIAPEANNKFGYISYSGLNIGDDIQAIAAKRFLPENALNIDREFVGESNHSETVRTLINGWFMYDKHGWYTQEKQAPEKSWPPADCIDPFITSFHIGHPALILKPAGVEYLKQHGPVGARDDGTLQQLKRHNIPCYFSGCLTLTLENPYNQRDDVIYLVDVNNTDTVNFIRNHANCRVEHVVHGREALMKKDNPTRLNEAQGLLNKYAKARCVITERLHAAMPCLGLETPILFLQTGPDTRLNGLRELAHFCTHHDLVTGKFSYDFNNPPANPSAYKALREQLIADVTNWMQFSKKPMATE